MNNYKPSCPNAFLHMEKALAFIPKPVAAIAVMRHAEKEPAHKEKKWFKKLLHDDSRLLSAQGKADATALGHLLSDHIHRIEHSIMGRCRQTAACIAAGADTKEKIRPNKLLSGNDFIKPRGSMKDGKEKFGCFESFIDHLAIGENWQKCTPVKKHFPKMASRLLENADNGINIHVSHDWMVHILAFVAGAKITTFCEEQVDYLDTLFLWPANGKVCFYYKGRHGFCADDFCLALNKGGK